MRTLLRGLVRQTRSSFIDRRTQTLLVGELKKRIRRDQRALFDEVHGLISRLSQDDVYAIQPILQRYYLQGLYRDHEDIRCFLKAPLDSWPSESLRTVIGKQNNTLDQVARHEKRLHSIKFPLRQERSLPSVTSIMNIQNSSEHRLEPLSLAHPPPVPYTDKDQHLNGMLTKVLTLYRFLMGNSFVHSRNLQSPIVVFPLTLCGEEIAECRKRNMIKKKLSYIRQVIKTIPPLEQKDSEYLTALLDSFYDTPPRNGKLGMKIRREYKKFLRRTFIIDDEFNIKSNKYAFIRAKEAPSNVYFT